MAQLTPAILESLAVDPALPLHEVSRLRLCNAAHGDCTLSYAEEAVLLEWARRHRPRLVAPFLYACACPRPGTVARALCMAAQRQTGDAEAPGTDCPCDCHEDKSHIQTRSNSMPYLETVEELAEALANLLGVYNQGMRLEGDIPPSEVRHLLDTQLYHHSTDCECRGCWCAAMENRIRAAVAHEKRLQGESHA